MTLPPPPNVPAQLKLTPNQAAVVTAIERIMNATQVEANQLANVWGSVDVADSLGDVAQSLIQIRDKFIREKVNRLVVASALPPVLANGTHKP